MYFGGRPGFGASASIMAISSSQDQSRVVRLAAMARTVTKIDRYLTVVINFGSSVCDVVIVGRLGDRSCQPGDQDCYEYPICDRNSHVGDRERQMSMDSEQSWRPPMVTTFKGVPLPEAGVLAGYSALIDRYDIAIPLPSALYAIGTRRNPKSSDAWQLLTSRQSVPQNLGDHLEFALKNEGVNLLALKVVFSKVPKTALESWISKTPGGANTRRVWFLYEWLSDKTLDVPPVPKIRAVPVIDRAKQFGLEGGDRSARHSVIDNLPGTKDFCPLVRRTPKLDVFEERGFDQLAREVVGRTHPDVIARAAAFLVLKDSKSSFFIESERPTHKLAARWARAISEAGLHALTIEELVRLQGLVLADARFVRHGLREKGGFVGVHDRINREPLPEHISARWDDLNSLMRGLVAYSNRAKVNKVDAVTTAAAIAFGFVYIHPFEDGNGRIHRWLFVSGVPTPRFGAARAVA